MLCNIYNTIEKKSHLKGNIKLMIPIKDPSYVVIKVILCVQFYLLNCAAA